MAEKIDIKSMNLDELIEFIESIGEKKFRAKQIYEWLHIKQVESFDDMSNISKDLKARLDEISYITCLKKVDVQISKIDGTRKYFF